MLLIATVCSVLLLFFLGAYVVPWALQFVRDPITVPDGPEPFGLGTAWLAVRTADIDRVIRILELDEVQLANWKSGLAFVEDDQFSNDWVFVTPPVDGWTFVVGLALPYPVARGHTDRCLPLLLSLGKAFDDVQYFYACPAIDLYAWSRFSDEKLRRSFAWGDDGLIWDKGRVSEHERRLGLRVFSDDRADVPLAANDDDADQRGYPEVEHVLKMAGLWSLNPESFDRLPEDPAQGYIGRAPRVWHQVRAERRAKIVEPQLPGVA